MKLLCNICYAEVLDVHNYNGVLYVDPCSCIIDKHEEDLLYDCALAYENGMAEGNQEGMIDMKNNVIEGLEDIPEHNEIVKRRFINKLNRFMDKI